MPEHEKKEDEYSFYDLFIPLTTKKSIIFIALIGFIVFFNMLFNGFVWDDNTYILGSPDVHSLNVMHLLGNNIFNVGGYYRPITAVYFANLYAMFKETSFFYHAFQLIVHITCGILLFLFLKKFFNKPISLILSLIFIVHPIQVESVSYISSSDSPLLFIFGISALLLSSAKNSSLKKIMIVFGLLLLSLLTKESGILFVFIVLLYRVLFIKKNKLVYFLGGIITIVSYFVIRLGIGKVYFTTPLLDPIARLPLSERLISIPAIIVFYLKTFFYPSQFAIDQFWFIKSIDFNSFYIPLFVVLVFFSMVFLLGYYFAKSNKNSFLIFLFFSGWFISGLFLYIQIFPLDMTVADRWFYFPIVGLLGIVGIVLKTILSHRKNLEKTIYIIAAISIGILSIRTMVRNTNWIDAKTLYTHDSQVVDNFDIENSLGSEYNSTNNYTLALMHFNKSVGFFPYEVNLFNVGSQYEKLGNLQKAQSYYAMALTKTHYLLIPHKHLAYTYERYGYVLLLTDNYKTAREQTLLGLKDYPENVNLWIVLALSEYKLHNQSQALSAAKKAKALLSAPQTNYIYSKILNKQSILIPKE